MRTTTSSVWPRQGMPLLTSGYRTHLPVTKRKSSGGRMGGGRARTSPPGERLPSPRPAPDNIEGWGADRVPEALVGSDSHPQQPDQPLSELFRRGGRKGKEGASVCVQA